MTIYGTFRGRKGGIGTFIVEDMDSVPAGAIQIVESDECRQMCHEKAIELREQAMLEEDPQPVPEGADDIVPGRVCVHDDGMREHVAVVLDVGRDEATALFLTSMPEWSNGFRGRRATREELAMVAYKQTKAATYLVRVVRDLIDFRSLRLDVPEHWVSGWLKEFGCP